MKLNEAIEVLKERSAWIRSYFGESTHAKAIDTVVKELEKPLPTDECNHPFNEVDRCEGVIYFCNVCKKYVYKNEAI